MADVILHAVNNDLQLDPPSEQCSCTGIRVNRSTHCHHACVATAVIAMAAVQVTFCISNEHIALRLGQCHVHTRITQTAVGHDKLESVIPSL